MPFLAKSRLSGRGFAVIPREVRGRLGLQLGGIIAFEDHDGEIVIRPWRAPAREDPSAVFHEWAGIEDDEAYADL